MRLDKRSGQSFSFPAPLAAGGGCANTALAPRPNNLALVGTAVLCLINQQRTAAGLAPLRANARLGRAAQRHSTDMARSGVFNHTGSAGDTIGVRISSSGYLQSGRAASIAENIAWVPTARGAAAGLVADWLSSPEHRVNLLGSSYRDTGIAFAVSRPTGALGGQSGITVTEDFGGLQ